MEKSKFIGVAVVLLMALFSIPTVCTDSYSEKPTIISIEMQQDILAISE